MVSINKLLDDSVLALNTYQAQLTEVPETESRSTVKTGDALGNLVAVLTSTTVELKEVSKSPIIQIDSSKLKALQSAIEKLTTECKINVIQYAIFGINMPLSNILRDVQNLIITVEKLKRGKRVSSIEGMEEMEENKHEG